MTHVVESSVPGLSAADRAIETREAESAAGRVWPAALAILLGLVVVAVVGFAPGIVHQAAHDTRHTMVFPCH